MPRLLQNRVAGSRRSLPVTIGLTLVVWVLCGLLPRAMWGSLLCFMAATALMVELNNQNSLIRVYSRMVSCSFLVMSCASCYLFTSLSGCFMLLCFVAFLLISFRSYQDAAAQGYIYYAFFFLGLASMVFMPILFFLPLLWLLMLTHLQCLSWRTFAASLLGVFTPYWFVGVWMLSPLCHLSSDVMRLATPFSSVFALLHPEQLLHSVVSGGAAEYVFGLQLLKAHVFSLAFVVVLGLTGIVHFLRTSYLDKFRVRQLYQLFIWLWFFTFVLIFVLPQHYDMLLWLLMVCTSPLIAHFLSLTSTRFTNAASCLFVLVAILLTAYNIWSISLNS